MADHKAPKTFALSDPIEHDGRLITEVQISKPKVKDLKRMNVALDGVTDQLDQGIVLAAILTGLPVEVIADFFPQAKAPGNGALSLPRPPTG